MDAVELRDRRVSAGLTQRQLAARSGVPQPNIAAYERGTRAPSAATVARLTQALAPSPSERLDAQRDRIFAAAAARRLSGLRVFGSVARGDTTESSDIDLLVHPADDASIFDLAGFRAEAEDILGVPVDVVSDRGTGPTMERILAEAVPL